VVVVAARLVVGGGCADKNFTLSAPRLGPSCNEVSLREAMGVETELTIDTCPLDQDDGLKRFCTSSNVKTLTKFTNCEFKSEIRQRLSSLVNRPSQRRHFSSLRTRSNTRSTSSLAAWHQWSKSPILTKDFTIRAWFSMRSWARANFFALELLNK